jgi:peptidoglycan/LPS O-acetylase OafA/YrhL
MLNIKTNLNISSIKRISYRKDLNGLRALSVLAVVFYHSDIEVFKGGWLGVDIFFVISGYLISNIIVSELNSNTFSFKKFYIRRIRRIIPALFSFISTSTFFAYWLLTPKAIVEYVNSVTASIFFYANYYFQNLDFYTSESLKLNPTIHTWSLAIEEQFYLVFPLIAVIFYRYFKKYFFINFVVLFFFSIFLNSLTQDIVKFYQLQYRAWEILFGVIIMILRSKF